MFVCERVKGVGHYRLDESGLWTEIDEEWMAWWSGVLSARKVVTAFQSIREGVLAWYVLSGGREGVDGWIILRLG